MPEQLIFPSEALPPNLKCQILSYIRVEWSWVFQGDNRFWDYTIKTTHPVNVVLIEQDVLISHAEVNWRDLTYHGETFKVYGLSAVFTYPAFRHEGYGKKVVDAATSYIDASNADVAMLFCLPDLKDFYVASGWIAMEKSPILCGDPDQPDRDEGELLMMRFVSAKGQQARHNFENQPVYVGRYTW